MKLAPTIFALALLGTAGITGCKPMAPSKPLSELTPKEASGHRVFVEHCARCHYANSTRGLHGPGLEGLFREPYLPSGVAATNARVTDIIVHGRGMMPAMGDSMDEAQLEDLLAYLHTL